MPQYLAVLAANAFVGALGAYASTAAWWVAYGAVYLGATAAISYGVSALAADAASRDNPGQLLQTTILSDAPRQIIVGERQTAGSRVGRYVTGAGNNNLIDVIALADHRCEGALNFLVNKISVLTNLVHGVRQDITAYRSDTARLWVTWYDGRWDQAADANLVSRSLVNQPDWTSFHRGRGVSYAIVEMQWDDDVMLTPVEPEFIIRGGRWYDRREDDTAGGVGDHRHTDPDTWTYSNNPDVFADHYNLGVVPYPDAPMYSWGAGLKTWQVPFDIFKSEADISDEQVLKKDGVTYQDRYRLNAIFSGADSHKNIIQKCARAKAGRVVDRGGRISIIGPQARTPVMTLYDDDLISGEQSTYSDKLSISELYNQFRGTFPDPSSGFQPIEYPKLEDSAWLAADGGDELPEDVDIDVDTDEERVQRLVWLHAKDRRRQGRLTESYVPAASELEDGDWFERVSWRFPSGKLFEVIKPGYSANSVRGMFVQLTSKEVDPSDVAWAEDMAADISRPPAPTDEAEFVFFEAPTLTCAADTITGGGATLPAIKITLTNATDPRIRTAQILITSGIGAPITSVTIEAGDGLANELTVDQGVTNSTDYYITARYQGLIKPSEYSSTESVTTGADFIVPTAGAAATIADGAVTIASFAAGLAPVEIVATLPVTGNYEGRTAMLTTNGKLYRYHSGAWTAEVPTVDLTGTVTGAQIAAAAIDNTKLASGLTTVEIVATLPVTGNFTGRTVMLTSDGKLYRYASGAFTSVVAAADITGAIATAQIATDAITAALIAAGAVGSSELAAGSVIAGKIAALSIVAGDIAAGAITAGKIAALSITAGDIAANAITTAKLAAGAVTATEIAALAITASKLAIGDTSNIFGDADMVEAANFVATTFSGSLSGTGLTTISKNRWISGAQNTGGTLTLAPASVEPSKPYYLMLGVGRDSATDNPTITVYADWYSMSNVGVLTFISSSTIGSVVATNQLHYLSNTFTSPSNARRVKLRMVVNATTANTVITAHSPTIRRAANGELIVDGSITAIKIAALTITANELAAGAVTAGKIAALSITAAEIAANTITTAKIAAAAITATEIAALAITASKLAITDSTSLVASPDFSDSAVWTRVGGAIYGTYETSGADVTALNAARVFRVTGAALADPATRYNYLYQRAYSSLVVPGKPYHASASYCVTTGFNGYIYLDIEWLDAAGSVISTSVIGFANYLTVAAASTVTGVFSGIASAPATAVKGYVRLIVDWSTDYATRNKGGTGSFAFPAMRRAANGELIVDGSITAAKIAALTITANEIAAGAIVASKITLADVTNYVRDDLFAEDSTCWSFVHFATSTSTEITGQLAASRGISVAGAGKTEGTNSTAMSASGYRAKVESGKSYRFAFSYRVSTGFTGIFAAYVQWYDQAGSAIGGITPVAAGTDYRYVAAVAAANGSVTGIAAAPSTAAYASIIILCAWSGAASGSLTNAGTGYAALPRLNRAASGELIVDGAITAAKISVSTLSAISADLGNITAGAIDLTSGSYVVRHGAGFGASSDLVLWYGLGSISRATATKTNGVFALATDGKVYYGSAELSSPVKVSIGSAINVVGSSGFTGNITVTATGGSGSYTYLWTKMPYEAGIAATLTNATTATVTVAASLSTGQDSTGRVQCVVRDSLGNTAVISQSYNFSKTS